MKNFNEPKIYTGGVDIENWEALTKLQKEKALSKRWYVYYSFRNPETKKLERQLNQQLDANRLSSKSERLKYLEYLRGQIKLLLHAGFNPYMENQQLYDILHAANSSSEKGHKPDNGKLELSIKPNIDAESLEESGVHSPNYELQSPVVSIEDAFLKGMLLKQNMMSPSSYNRYKSRINRFKLWLAEQVDLQSTPITSIRKRTIIEYLNTVLISSSARNRNNTRVDIASLFQTLENNEIIAENFVSKIDVLRSAPVRNKTYTISQEHELFKRLKEADPVLLLFVKFICYNFLRPKEVCRLKIKDIDIKQRKLYVRAKNKPVKIKIIPEIMLKELSLDSFNPEHYLFHRSALGGFWDANEDSRRDYYTKKFKAFKDELNLGSEYGLYSFRHTFITKLYREFSKEMTPAETKGKLMLITGHTTLSSLEKYLRDVDAEIPDDYSQYL